MSKQSDFFSIWLFKVFTGVALFPVLVFAQSINGSAFLLKRYPHLHIHPDIQSAVRVESLKTKNHPQKPLDQIGTWLNRVEKMFARAQKSEWAKKRIKDAFFKKFVIKPEDVPQSYYDYQVKLARDRGHGNIEITDAQKSALAETLIADQIASLDAWLDYLLSKDTMMYPVWAKIWVIHEVAKLSKFEPKTGQFGHRSRHTVSPFIELNREALAEALDFISKPEDPNAISRIQSVSFGNLYSNQLEAMGAKPATYPTQKGKWIRFKRGSDPGPLVASLRGKNTGWCTAAQETAKTQLAQGDFHIYYSQDLSGNPTHPRIAIRMEGENIAEIRGVAQNQNLDSEISNTTILSTKLKAFGERAKQYQRKDQNMRRLTEILEQTRLSGGSFELSVQDIGFLYEMEGPIEGFGYKKDPRINEAISLRDKKRDLSNYFSEKYKPEEIATEDDEFVSGKTKYFFGDFSALGHLENGDGKILPEVVTGFVSLYWLASAKGLTLPIEAKKIAFANLETGDGLVFPRKFKGDVSFAELTEAGSMELPEVLHGSLSLHKLKSAKNLKLPSWIEGDLALASLRSAEGLVLPQTLRGVLDLGTLKSAKGLTLPKGVTGYFGPKDIKGYFGLKIRVKLKEMWNLF